MWFCFMNRAPKTVCVYGYLGNSKQNAELLTYILANNFESRKWWVKIT